MQSFIIFVLLLDFISPCLCTRLNNIGTQNSIYNVMNYGAHGDGKSDDTQAFATTWSNVCNSVGMSTLVIPAKKTFLVTKLHFSGRCKGKIHIQFEGKIVAPSREAWKAGESLISIENLNGLTIDGNGQGGADGDGSTWWQCSGCQRPGVLHFHSCNDLSVSNIKITNSPRSHVSVNMCNGATFSHISIDSPPTSPNTDGFDISFSSNILVKDSNIKSGDDCIAINGGSSFINATGVTCGPGHGISVGSLGKTRPNDQVSNVNVRNCTFIGTSNGGRIKTAPDTDVSVSDVTYRGVYGTCDGNIAVNLDCSSAGCHNIILDQINIKSNQQGKKVSAICHNAYGTATNTIPSVPCLLH
ncbi:unnamed protein product [Trifolium pratense]|uniref:Uncharacterized protein n=1 Tax=Trifolium pratense TaxID=57577 RepID=A0ACB0IVN5_TRIPR|nr:unnamed protein product [Trifolium pratense]